MFGETNIKLKSPYLKFNGKKLKLPPETLAEVGEEVALTFDLRMQKLIIQTVKAQEELAVYYERCIIEGLKEKKLTYSRAHLLKTYIYAKIFFMPIRVGKGLTITLPDEVIKQLHFEKSLYGEGVNETLEVYKDEETYKKLSKK